MSDNLSGEKRYEHVFGDTFAMYSRKEMEEFIEPFKVRFERNGLDPQKIFAGKKCFDAGCGNGRGTIFMLMNGAEDVTSYDFSQTNVESTEKFVRDFGFTNFETLQGTLEEVPFEDEAFDFIWCNGVIMHTERPNKCLEEIARILKVNGQAWLYIYGAGGVYWRIIFHLRDWLKDINIEECIAVLKTFRYQTRYVAEFIDDWFATYLRSYTHNDLSRRLMELGFERPMLLKYGMDYDTSHRKNLLVSSKEKALMGEGDLRYLLTKKSNVRENNQLIPEDEYGSEYQWPEIITSNIDPLFKTLFGSVGLRGWMKIAIAGHIQRELRLLLNKEKFFELEEIMQIIQYLINQAIIIKNI